MVRVGSVCWRRVRYDRARKNLDQNNSYAVRILDPHLHQPPGLLLRATHHRHSRGQQPPTLRFDVTHLNPKGQAVPGCMGRPATNLEEAAAEKEH